jgi:cytochrome c biogenesis protein CcmG/thiol:disulfide interchange protein DsbE
MKSLVRFVPLGLFAAFAGLLAFGLNRNPSAIPSVLIDRPMPDFSLSAIDNSGPGLSRLDLAGRVSLVNVFASWCSVCVVEHPVLMTLSRGKIVPIYGINWKDAPGRGQAWLDRYGDPYVRKGDDSDGRLAIDLGVTGAPETFVVDRKGRIRYKQIGAITDEVWEETLKPLIAKLEAES